MNRTVTQDFALVQLSEKLDAERSFGVPAISLPSPEKREEIERVNTIAIGEINRTWRTYFKHDFRAA